MTATTPGAAKQFEHTWIVMPVSVSGLGKSQGWDQNAVATMQQLGRDGFELVSTVMLSNGLMLFFKRQIR